MSKDFVQLVRHCVWLLSYGYRFMSSALFLSFLGMFVCVWVPLCKILHSYFRTQSSCVRTQFTVFSSIFPLSFSVFWWTNEGKARVLHSHGSISLTLHESRIPSAFVGFVDRMFVCHSIKCIHDFKCWPMATKTHTHTQQSLWEIHRYPLYAISCHVAHFHWV